MRRSRFGVPVATAERPGDRLILAGSALFFLGMLALVADLVPFFLGHPDQPLWLNLLALLTPLGLGVALLGLLRQALARRRESRRAGADRQ
ncbi:MAG: hypothetical protein M3P91_12240 [Actinomycetota bacterium]|nr:hypothetical protein [Actinomycetota bacterium]